MTGVTVDHIPHELSPNGTLDTAPKDFAVLGLTSLGSEPVQLGTFSYNLGGAPIQEFTIEVSWSIKCLMLALIFLLLVFRKRCRHRHIILFGLNFYPIMGI